MTRAPETPLILWICAAVCAHFIFAEGGDQVATFHDDLSYIYQLGSRARSITHGKDQTIDIITNEEGKPQVEEPEPPPKPEPTAEKKQDPPKKDEPKAPPKKDEPKKEDVKVAVKEEDPLKKLDEPPLEAGQPHRGQAAREKNQQDNPNARFIADEANNAEEETVATQTSHDQDETNPTPGCEKTGGPKDRTGDSDRTKIAESEEHKGDKDKAPGEKGTEFDVAEDAKPIDEAAGARRGQPTPAVPGHPEGRRRRQGAPAGHAEPASAAARARCATARADARGRAGSAGLVVQSDPTRAPSRRRSEGAPGTTNQKPPSGAKSARHQVARPRRQARPRPGEPQPLEHGRRRRGRRDQLRKEREADGERRKSEHRGSWTASNFERWRNAIENYVSSVKPGNQTALNTAAVPFASYLNTIHNRIHPIFADSFLGSLDNLPKTHPMNDPKLITRLEIVVSPKEGRIVKMGVVKTSGITAFDIAALDSVHRAQPFGPAPGRDRLARRQRLPPLGVPSRRGLRVLHDARAPVHAEQPAEAHRSGAPAARTAAEEPAARARAADAGERLRKARRRAPAPAAYAPRLTNLVGSARWIRLRAKRPSQRLAPSARRSRGRAAGQRKRTNRASKRRGGAPRSSSRPPSPSPRRASGSSSRQASAAS